MTKVIDSKEKEIEIPSKFIDFFSISEKNVLEGLSPKGLDRLTTFLDVKGESNLDTKELEELQALTTFRKKSDRTPMEQFVHEILVGLRLKKMMISKLIDMQYMWIGSHRISDNEIKSYDGDELRRQYKMHDILWNDYVNKPKAPQLCQACGIEVGRCEVVATVDGNTVYANDYCRECYSNE